MAKKPTSRSGSQRTQKEREAAHQRIRAREYEKSREKLRSGELDAQDFVQKYLIPRPGKKED